MTTRRSIFDKVCPSCMTTLSLDAKQCSCGYDFDQNNPGSAMSSEEIRVKAEELYESYLAARADQAAQSVKTAQAEFARDPANLEKSSRVANAIREAQAARATLAAQSAHIAEMKKALPPAAPPPSPAPVPAVPKKRAVKAVTPKPIAASSPARTIRKTITAVTVAAVAGVKRAASVVVPKKNAPAPKKPPIITPVQTTTPNPAFRQAQAAKAEKILRAARITKSVISTKKEKSREMPVVEPKAAPAPIPVKAAPRLYAPRDKRECPNCTATVANDAARCRCGYEFSSSEQHIPPLAMSEEERAEFAKLFTRP